MLVLELIERLTDYIQFVNLRGHCRETRCETRLLFFSKKERSRRGLTTSVGLFLSTSEDGGVLENRVIFLSDGIEGIVEACVAAREADGRLLDGLIWGTLGLQLLVLWREIIKILVVRER